MIKRFGALADIGHQIVARAGGFGMHPFDELIAEGGRL